RQRHGTPRNLIIGIEMALADGRLARAGGRVVKNVAGYDLMRLVCGSFGSLAVITSVTFKLAPLPAASRTIVVPGGGQATVPVQGPVPRTGTDMIDLARAIVDGPLVPTAVEFENAPPRLMLRFEGTARACDEQAAAVCRICDSHGASAAIVADDDGA